MSGTAQQRSGSSSFSGLLAIAFIILKLTHVINWSWLWVLSPIWIPFAILAVMLLIFGIVVLIMAVFD